MRAVVQRVATAKVTVGDEVTGEIGRGLLILLGVGTSDDSSHALALARKVCELRIFEDIVGKMNLSVQDVGGSVLVVSQFTLMGDCRKGRRPSFDQAARPEIAELLYVEFVRQCAQLGVSTETGRFRADMQVSLVNDGPVTLIVEV